MSPGWFRPCSTIQRSRSSFALKVNNDLTGRIHSTGDEEAIAYVDRLNKLVEICARPARGGRGAEVDERDFCVSETQGSFRAERDGSTHAPRPGPGDEFVLQKHKLSERGGADVSCAFDLDHYRELLDAATAGGYRFALFEGEPREGDVILRHDVDLSLDAALRMAEIEADAGAAATYFLMTGSVFYNLGSEEGERALGRLRELGHRVGLHAVYPRLDLDDRFDPVIAWHNPDPEYMRSPVKGAINVMESPWFDPATYRSDSNQHWRSGCPHEELAGRRVPVAAAADASRDLGLRRRDDGRDDARQCWRRRRSAGSSSSRADRIDLS